MKFTNTENTKVRNDDDLKDLEGQGEVLYGIIANFLSIFPSTLQKEYDSDDDDGDYDDDDNVL